MAANPLIADATGFYPGLVPNTVTMMVLYSNNTAGLTKFVPFKDTGTTCFYYPGVSQTPICAPVTNWNLKELQFMDAVGLGGAFDFGCVESNYCPDSGCPSACSTSWARTSFLSDLFIHVTSTVVPNKPPNLTITPLNGALTISWGAVMNMEVFAYYVEVFRGATFVADGFTENTLRNVTIGGLQNGVTYDVYVSALSHSAVRGSSAIGTGMPAQACMPSWTCEQPLNGYEKDGCGNRRLNAACNPACTPSWTCEQPLNGYEKDGCGNRRINAACNPACTPIWKCELPLNGYESDGCGNRRINAACNPTCTPIWKCELPLNGYESDGCGNRRINTICNPTGGCIPSWKCEQPLNGYESDGCDNRRTNTSCNPPPSGPGAGTIIVIGLLGAGILGAVVYASRKRR